MSDEGPTSRVVDQLFDELVEALMVFEHTEVELEDGRTVVVDLTKPLGYVCGLALGIIADNIERSSGPEDIGSVADRSYEVLDVLISNLASMIRSPKLDTLPGYG